MSCALLLFVVCATLRHAAADCTALGCVLTAGEHKWSAIVRGDEWTLSLSISEEQDSAAGSLLRGGVAEAVSAAVSFSRSSNEAMVAWASAETQANWSAIIFHLAPHTIYVHGSGGELVELERVEIERSAARPTATTSGALTDPEGGTGSSSYLPVPGTNVRLRSPIDGACLLTVPGSDAPMFGSCDGAGSVWALLTGREPYSRGLRNVERGMCLQRKCYSGGKNTMQLGKCGVCGTMRWTLDRSRLVTPSLTSSAFFCISRALSSPEAAAAARAATVTKLNGQAASLSEQLELTKLKSEQTAQALDGTQKQLKMARTAREAALTSERHWKSQLMEAQGRADALQEATGAAMNETDAASVRLGETTSTIRLLNASLVAAEARALRAAEKAQQSEAAQRQLAMDDTERAKRAAAREVELEKVSARAISCEARITEEWKGQAECKEAAEARAVLSAQLASQRNLTQRAQAAADEARHQAVGREAAAELAAQCAAAKVEVEAQLSVLLTKHATLTTETTACRQSEQAALTSLGVAEAQATSQSAVAGACAAEAKRSTARLAHLETELANLAELNVSCATELERFVNFVDEAPVGVSTSVRLVRTARRLLGADAAVSAHQLRGLLRAFTDALSAPVKAKWYAC
ncbi:hypothetical protein Ctob_003839 [Chrysochromulina tobinii]|uniref:Uncharacterized protein n=1 Tax=Chrysochromulina tobinii TaxID=1460289 RepID=A0A0M0JJH4_9EUKA|nr:hypothetical protein Ctob_003839 [Chrysochromulina tobinii]|eukprot:KOO26635.1 hypothetical protein Ctob_003839 [Chrysochromulina sp. CCMP291]